MPSAVILSQGDEVVTGQVVDSNAAWLAERLTELGFDVLEHLAVRDISREIEQAAIRGAHLADVVVCTGGLGPTSDDLTAGAVANAFSRPLELDTTALENIRAMYARYKRVMPAINEKQAWLPKGSVRIDNDWGTAPAFSVQEHGATLYFLPGVPREMKALWTHKLAPELQQGRGLLPGLLVTLRTTGVGESNLQERIGPFDEPDVMLSFRTTLPENHIKLRFEPSTSAKRVAELVDHIAARIGSPVFAIERPGDPSMSLHEVVGAHLAASGQTIGTAESCTGGLIASQLTGIAGASAWFIEGAVTYANAAKSRTLGVPEAMIAEHGAVSEIVARQMAIGIRERCGSTWGMSTTGIAGPTGGSEHKPVGTVHIALAGPQDQVHHRLLHLGGDRRRIQALTAGAALDLLRRAQQTLI